MTKRKYICKKIAREEFDELTRPLLGLSISRTWRGAGTAIFLELGELSEEIYLRKDGTTRTSLRGQSGVMIEWSWRIERARSIELGSWSGNRKISNGLNRLRGLSIVDVQAEGRLPELSIQLSGQRWLHSWMTTESQPAWCLFLNDREQWIISKNGQLYLCSKTEN